MIDGVIGKRRKKETAIAVVQEADGAVHDGSYYARLADVQCVAVPMVVG